MFLRILLICVMLIQCTPSWAHRNTHTHTKIRSPQLSLSHATSCLISTIYHEARGEKHVSRVEVGRVVLARVGDPHFAPSVCGVVLQKTYVKKKHKHYCQFSWVCHLSKHIVLDKTAYLESVKAAHEALAKGPSSAKYFNSTGSCPVKVRGSYTLGRITFCVPRKQAKKKRFVRKV